MKRRHINIPIFIPHLGCPNDCVFCNQRKISGKNEFVFASAVEELEKAFSTVDTEKSDVEIAFFGGSFTGIERGLMISLLELAKGYIDEGKVTSIRLSTRPDYINEEILEILKKYSVKKIELGIQSINDNVLSVCKRGHTFSQTKDAVKAVVNHGFELVGQMMVGLPFSTLADEIETAKFICESGAVAARIYPTVVFKGTYLETMSKNGEYIPLDSDSAVERSAHVFEEFLKFGVPVIRVGLHSSENLSSEDEVYAGANHPALGERIMSRVYLRKIIGEMEKKQKEIKGKNITVYVAPGETSKTVGNKGENKKILAQEFGIKSVKIVEKADILVYNINLEIN